MIGSFTVTRSVKDGSDPEEIVSSLRRFGAGSRSDSCDSTIFSQEDKQPFLASPMFLVNQANTLPRHAVFPW